MKKLLLILGLSVMLFSCEPPGSSRIKLDGNENLLPAELKGLKVFRVELGGGDYCKVAILDNQINSTTYYQNKSQRSTIILNKNQQSKIISYKEIILENDSILILKK